MDNISTNMLFETNQTKFFMYPHHHSIMQVTSTQEGRTRIPSIATPCEASYFNICNIYTYMLKEKFFKTL